MVEGQKKDLCLLQEVYLFQSPTSVKLGIDYVCLAVRLVDPFGDRLATDDRKRGEETFKLLEGVSRCGV